MKVKINMALVVLALMVYWIGLCNASAFYDPGAQRWLNRDPLAESGFEASHKPGYKSVQKKAEIVEGSNLYTFVINSPTEKTDYFGLDFTKCLNADPEKSDSSVCDKYGNRSYVGTGLKCFCKCAGDSDWSQAVRGCLACMDANGADMAFAHTACYEAASKKFTKPTVTIGYCYCACQ